MDTRPKAKTPSPTTISFPIMTNPNKPKNPSPKKEGDSESVSSEESAEEEKLELDGVLVRNPDASSSSSSSESESDDSDDSDDTNDEDKVDMKEPASKKGDSKLNNKKKRAAKSDKYNIAKQPNKKQKTDNDDTKKKQQKEKKKKKTKGDDSDDDDDDDIIQVEFTFHDFDERFFHGVKNLLHASSTLYQPHSSALADLMIDNISVGTVCSTEGDAADGTVCGFASILNVKEYGKNACLQAMKKYCLDHCPAAHRSELTTVWSGDTKRPAGLYLQARMVNMPLEIVYVLQHQLVQDMDYAVEHAQDEDDQKAVNFGAFVRLAPASMDGPCVVYKHFDDEVLATNAEFVYAAPAPPSCGSEETSVARVMVLTRTGHTTAMTELQQLTSST